MRGDCSQMLMAQTVLQSMCTSRIMPAEKDLMTVLLDSSLSSKLPS